MARWNPIIAFIALFFCLGVVIGFEDEFSSKKIPNNSDNEVNYYNDLPPYLNSILSAFNTQFMTRLGNFYPISTPIEANALPKDVKPKDVKSKDVKPKDVKPKDVKPKDVKPKDVKPKEIESKEIESKEVESKEIEIKQKIPQPNPEPSVDFVLPFDHFLGQRIIESGSLFPEINNIFEQNTMLKNMSKMSEITVLDPFINFIPVQPIQPIQPKKNRTCCTKNKQCSNQHCLNSGCVKHTTKNKTAEIRREIELIDRDLLVCVLPGLLGLIVLVTGIEIIRRHNKMVKTTKFLSPQYNHIQHC